MDRLLRYFFAFAVMLAVGLITYPNHALAQAKPAQGANEFLMTNAVGDLVTYATPNTARIHLQGSLALQSADYFRGRFDGIKEDPSDWGVTNHVAIVAELWKNQTGPIRDMNFVIGLENGLTDAGQFRNDREPRIWYEANPYVGFSMRLSRELLVGATLTSYTSPNGFLGTTEEIALTAKYQGTQYALEKLNPQAKIAVPMTDGKGLYAELSITPKTAPLPDTGITIEFPITIGAGFNDYYRAEDDTAAFISGGVVGRLPITATSAYGNWSAFAGAYVIFRQSSIAKIYGSLDDAGDSVVYGQIGLNLAF